MNLKRGWKYALLSLVFMLIGFAYSYHLPQIKSWLLFEISDASQRQGPFYFFADSIDLSIFPLGLKVRNIRLIPKPELRAQLDKITIHEVRAGLDPLTFLGGRFGLSEVIIVQPKVRARIPFPAKGANSGSGPQKAFQVTELPIKKWLNYPIHHLEIENLSGEVTDMATKMTVTASTVDLIAENWAGNLVVTLSASPVALTSPTSTSGPMLFAGRIQLSPQQLQIQNFKFQKDTSFLSLTGLIQGQLSKLKWNSLKVETAAHFDIEPLAKLVGDFKKDAQIPEIVGQWDQKITIEGINEKIRTVGGYIKTENLSINKYKIGTLEGGWTFKEDTLLSTSISVTNSAGKIELKNLRVENKIPYAIAGLVHAENVELKEFLTNLGKGNIPVLYNLTGDIPCEGRVENFELNCTGVIAGRNFKVWSPNSQKTVVQFRESKIDGSVHVNTEGVYPKAIIHIGQTKGEASGRILFKEGFHFDYKTPQFNFSDLETLAGLKFEGQTAIEGSTAGDSDAATIAMKIETKDLWFEDFGVGNAKSDLNYKAGDLTFPNLEGLFRTSRYVGNLTVNLDHATINARAKIPYLEINDLQRLFGRKVKLPFTSLGSGAGEVIVSGPLEFTELTYTVRSTIQNWSLNDERFNEAHFDITAKKGEVVSDRISIRKNKGVATMTGKGHPDGTIDTNIQARGLNLQDFQSLAQIVSSISGQLNFDMTMKGPVLKPDTQLKGTVTDTFIGTDGLPDSSFDVAFSRSSWIMRGSLLGGTLQMDLEVPLTNDAPFHWGMTAKNWNFAPVFAMISSDVNTREFDTSLTGQIELTSPKGGFWNSTGMVTIDNLRLKHGPWAMESTEKLSAPFENGDFSIPPWTIRGDNTLLTLQSNHSNRSKLNLSLNGKIEINLLSFLTPFMSDLRGSLSLAAQLAGSADDVGLVGSAFIEGGYARLRALPHAFEDIRMDVLFSRRQLLLNSFDSRFAEGRITGDGTIQFVELRNLPTDLRGHFENVNLNIPTGIQTRGSGDFHITGSWFPFVFASNYQVQDGLITRNFDEEESTGPTLKRANLLPMFLTQRDFEPLQYNITTNFEKGIRVRNALMEADFTGQLTIKGATSKPILGGDVNARRGGKLFFRETPFEISSANIRFNDPRENNPLIYLTANARIKEYDISMLAQGTPKNLKLSLQSEPQLANQAIITLLALGVDPNDLERTRDLREKTTSTDKPQDDSGKFGYEVGAALLSRNPLGKEIKKKTGIEVKFSSAVDQTDNTTLPRIVVSKEWSPKVNTSASRTFGSRVNQNVKLEYRLNNNVSVVGSWENKNVQEETRTQLATDYFGLDLQYKVEFK